MQYTIKPSENREYILLTVKGEFTGMNIMKVVVETHTLGMELGIHNYLMDATEARNIDSELGNFNFVYKDVPKTEGLDPQARVSLIVSPKDHSHDFIETVSQNTGTDLKLFRDSKQALEYLKQKKKSNPFSPTSTIKRDKKPSES